MKRLAYIDWLRGLACVLMFIVHCYDSWLTPQLQAGEFSRWAQILGTFPAPLFLFLAGMSVALTTLKSRGKGLTRGAVARNTIRRGGEIFALGVLFRLQEYALGYRWVPWTDLLRVDILNTLGISIALMGALAWLVGGETAESSRRRGFAAGLLVASGVALVTPMIWTAWRPTLLPWPLESYFDGVHNLKQPQAWLFPLFPWCLFAFFGLAVGFATFSPRAEKSPRRFLVWIAGLGASACILSQLFERVPIKIYPVHDYWHTHPDFFLLVSGVLLLVVALARVWCQWGWGQRGFSPLVQFGNTSLLVYWVHIEFVYGLFSLLPKHQCSIGKATIGLAVIFLTMLALSLWRTEEKEITVRVSTGFDPAVPEPAAG